MSTEGEVASTRRISVIRWIGKGCSSKIIMNEELLSKVTLPNAKENHTVLLSPASSSVVSERKTKKVHSCSFCGKSFQWRSHWESHERIHTGVRPFKCEICGKTFTRSDGLQCHKVLHTTTPCQLQEGDNKPSTMKLHVVQSTLPKCRICSRECYSFTGLAKHMQKHKSGIDLKCKVCNKIFTKRSNLEIHSRVHTGIKPYECNICAKSFSIDGNLKRHLLTHTGQRPHECVSCSACFTNPGHLTRHIQTKHSIQ